MKAHTLWTGRVTAPHHERVLTTAPVRNLNVAIFHDANGDRAGESR